MSQLPRGWSNATLGQVVSLRGEKQPPQLSPNLDFLGMEDVESNTSRVVQYRKAGEFKSNAAVFSPGEILYGRLRPYLNKALVADRHGMASAEFLVWKPAAGVEASFVLRRVMTNEFLEFVSTLDKGDRPRVDFAQIANFDFGLPPSSEQRRIVAKLESLTARTARARAELERVPTLVEHYKKSVLALAFSGELLRPSGRGSGARRKTMSLSALVSDLRYGTAQKCRRETLGTAVLRIPNVASGRVDLSDLKYAKLESDEFDRLKLLNGDILVVRSNGSADLVGRTALVTEHEAGLAFAGYLIRIRPNLKLIQPAFLNWMLSAPQTRAIVESKAKSTSGVHNINAVELGSLEIPLPKIAEQDEITTRIEVAFDWINRLASDHKKAHALLGNLDQAIHAKAFHGELVPQDPSDELASVLLARINAAQGTARRRRNARSDATIDSPPMRQAAEPKPQAYVAERARPAPRAEPAGVIEIDRADLICRIRRVFCTGGARERGEAIRELADDLGAQRVGSRIREELENGIRTAVRRGIIQANGTELCLAARTVEDYDRGFLKDQFLASLQGHVWTERDDALVQFARWMGYGRTGAAIDDKVRSLIHGLLKEGRLEADGTRIRRT